MSPISEIGRKMSSPELIAGHFGLEIMKHQVDVSSQLPDLNPEVDARYLISLPLTNEKTVASINRIANMCG